MLVVLILETVGIVSINFPQEVDSVVMAPNGAVVFSHINLKASGEVKVEIKDIPYPYASSHVLVYVKNGFLLNRESVVEKSPYDKNAYSRVVGEIRRIKGEMSFVKSLLSSVRYRIDLINATVEGTKKGVSDLKSLINLSYQLGEDVKLRDSLEEIYNELKGKIDSLEEVKKNFMMEHINLLLTITGSKNPEIAIYLMYPEGKVGFKPRYMVEYNHDDKIHLKAFAEVGFLTPLPFWTGKVVITNTPISFEEPRHSPWYIRDIYRVLEANKITFEEGKPVMGKVKVDIPSYEFTPISTRIVINNTVGFYPFKTTVLKLYEKTYPCKSIIVSYPEMSERGIMKVLFKPDMDLLSGGMDVMVKGELVASYRYDGATRGVEDTIFAGFEPFIIGSVKIVSQKRDDINGKNKTVLTKETRIEEISVKNLRKDRMEVVFYVRKPFASGNVNIRKFKIEPEGYEDLGEGLLMWRVSLKDNEAFKVIREITVDYPKGAEVIWR